MARKSKRKPERKVARKKEEMDDAKRWTGKSEREWKEWGDTLARKMEHWGERFDDRMNKHTSERMNERMNKRTREKIKKEKESWDEEWNGKEWNGRHERHKKKFRGWMFRTFGLAGPLLGAIFGIIFVAIAIFLLKFFNVVVGSNFISAISNFLYTNIYLLFAIFLFKGYDNYFSRRFSKVYWIFSPIAIAVRIVIALWFIMWILTLVNVVPQNSVIASVANFLSANLFMIFIAFAVLGFAFIIFSRFVMSIPRI
jgi:hypothetical protein